ncbi:DUF4012 domain-containing protein [Microbacterium testaceum]|uniref:DUF4012 domain-containing protein n=1 Tax=Microbacterium testaceum TaxID=2033 RepID=UPI0034370122
MTEVGTSVLPRAAIVAGRILAWALATLILVTALCTIWIGARGALAYRHLERVQVGASDIASSLTDDPSQMTSSLARLAADAREARDLTSDPAWKLAEAVPWVGPQLNALRTVAASSDQLLGESLLPLSVAAKDVSIDSFKLVNGHIDTSALSSLAAPASSAAVEATSAAQAVDDINRRPLLGVVDSAVSRAGKLFSQAAGAIDGLSRTSQLLPKMLGQDAPRNYLLVVQNNAEWRSLGGITGTAVLIHTDKGAVSLADTQSATGLVRELAEPIVPLSDDITQIYGTRPARYFHNLTQIPDFTVDGPIAREMYRSRTGVEVDGVLAVDPVVLSYLLKAIGPVELPTGDSLTDSNAVQLLMNEVYRRYADPAAQDAVFAGAASAVFQGLISGRGSTDALLVALGRASEERRLLVWSAAPDEQAVLDGTSLAGQLPVTDTRTARFGVYFNDGTGSKMSYYIKPDVTVMSDICQSVSAPHQTQLTLNLTLTSDAPADAAASLPEYITGGGSFGTAPGNTKTIINIYLPEGFALASAVSSDHSTFMQNTYDNRDVLTFGSELAPGASIQITASVRGVATVDGVEAFVTPTADSALSPIVSDSCTRY